MPVSFAITPEMIYTSIKEDSSNNNLFAVEDTYRGEFQLPLLKENKELWMECCENAIIMCEDDKSKNILAIVERCVRGAVSLYISSPWYRQARTDLVNKTKETFATSVPTAITQYNRMLGLYKDVRNYNNHIRDSITEVKNSARFEKLPKWTQELLNDIDTYNTRMNYHLRNIDNMAQISVGKD